MEQDLKEEALAVKRVYEGRKLNLDVITARMPNGKTIDREVVRRRANAVILGIKEDGNVLLVRQYRHSFKEGVLSLPAGKMDEGETIQQTAKREFQEETGYIANTLIDLGTYQVAPAYSDETCTVFLAKDLVKGHIKRDADEFLNLYEVPLSKFIQDCCDGTISDMRSCLACFKYLASEK